MVKNYAKLNPSPITAITPEGWLRRFLLLQKQGLTGHIEAAGAPFDRVGWDKSDRENAGNERGPGWWAYEQTAYHLDGKERLSILLRDRAMRASAKKVFEAVVSGADADGYLGPESLKNSDGWNRWPHVVFFRALWAEYEASGDKKILFALTRHYLNGTCSYERKRDVINVEPMLLLYLETGNPALLELAEKCFAAYNETCGDDNCARAQLSPKKAYAHGVTYNEYSKLGALLYICTGKKEYLKPSVRAYKKIDRYQMLPDGLHCSNEFLLDNDYMQSHETCDVSDYTWALGYLLMATGDGSYADRIEKCVFNAGIGCVEEHFRALQYFSTVNQLYLDSFSNHNDFFRGSAWTSMRPNPGTECCAGNVHRFMPNYCLRMWMQKKRSVAAVLYGPSSFSFGKGAAAVKIKEDTSYPYEDEIRFTFRMKKERSFPFLVRIPSWCEAPELTVNGEKTPLTLLRGFARIGRVWKDGDSVTLRLPSDARFVPYKDGVYVERGPLVYALGMKGKREIEESAPELVPGFPSYRISPDKPFNYALLTDRKPSFRSSCAGEEPFTLENNPLFITVSARRVPSWKATARKSVEAVHDLYTRPWRREKVTGTFVFTPRYPSPAVVKKCEKEKIERITLVPYGAAKVRVTVFPKAPDGERETKKQN